MRRIAWDKAQRRRCRIRWLRAGMPVPNHVMDPTPFRWMFMPWRIRVRRRMMRRQPTYLDVLDELAAATNGAFEGVDATAYVQALRDDDAPDYIMPDGTKIG